MRSMSAVVAPREEPVEEPALAFVEEEAQAARWGGAAAVGALAVEALPDGPAAAGAPPLGPGTGGGAITPLVEGVGKNRGRFRRGSLVVVVEEELAESSRRRGGGRETLEVIERVSEGVAEGARASVEAMMRRDFKDRLQGRKRKNRQYCATHLRIAIAPALHSLLSISVAGRRGLLRPARACQGTKAECGEDKCSSSA